jgi:hypothetical protein
LIDFGQRVQRIIEPEDSAGGWRETISSSSTGVSGTPPPRFAEARPETTATKPGRSSARIATHTPP